MALNLNEYFLIELFQHCLKKGEIIEVCKNHLKYSYLPNEEYKEVWSLIESEFYLNGCIPTIGILNQKYKDKEGKNQKVYDLLKKLSDSSSLSKESIIIDKFESFLKDCISVEFYDNFFELYKKGSREESRNYLFQTSEKLQNFSLTKEYVFTSIFDGFKNRQYQRKIDNLLKNEEYNYYKPVIGIDELDYLYPIKDTDTILFLSQSGVGKSTHLVQIGVENARRGGKGLHITLEGTKKEVEDKYDYCWSALKKNIIEYGELSEDDIVKYDKIANDIISYGGNVWVYSQEEFNKFTLNDLRKTINSFKKMNDGSPPDFILIDYLELIEPGDRKYAVSEEKFRRQALAKGLKNIAISEKIKTIIVPTQACDVSSEKIENEDFTLKRGDLSGDKNQVDPYSLFYTLNQTSDEYSNDTLRIFVDKSRWASKKQNRTIKIKTAYDYGKFYDRKSTLENYSPNLI